MQLLMAGIEGELTRRIWNAVDRSNPKKWRRTVPERAPHRIRHASAWFESPQNGSKSAQNLHFESLLGCFEAAALATSPMVVMGRPWLRRHGLLGPRRAPEVPIRMTLKEPKISTFAAIILNHNRFGRFFLLHTASQLQCGAGGALRLSGGASYDQKRFTSPRIRPMYPMCITINKRL